MMDAQYILAIGWTLIHSFWQLTLLAGIFYLVLLGMKNSKPSVKYWAGLFFMVLSVSVTSMTFILMFQKYGMPLAPAENIPVAGNPAFSGDMPGEEPAVISGFWQNIVYVLQENVRSLTVMYMIGLGFLLLRMIFNFWKIQNLKTRSSVMDGGEWSFLPGLIKRMEINVKFDLRWSAFVQSPMVVGVVRPVILIPASMVSNTPPSIMEAVLAHELAHIQRNDFVINIFQTLIETFFFYHPAVWYFSYVVRREREYSCDQKAVEAGCTREDLARALTMVGQVQNRGDWAMTFGSRSNELLNRVRYLLGYRSAIRYAPSTSIIYYGSLLGIFLLFSVGKSHFHKKGTDRELDQMELPIAVINDTLPGKKAYKVKSKIIITNGDSIRQSEMEVELDEDEFWKLDSFENQWSDYDSTIQVIRIDTIPGKKETIVVRTDEEVTVIVNGDTVSVHSLPDMKRMHDSLREVHIEMRNLMPSRLHLDSIFAEHRINLDSQRIKFDVQRLYHDSLQSQFDKIREFHFSFPDSAFTSGVMKFKHTFPDSLMSFGSFDVRKGMSSDSIMIIGDDTISIFRQEFFPGLDDMKFEYGEGIDSVLQSRGYLDIIDGHSWAPSGNLYSLQEKSQEIKELEKEIRRKEQELMKLRQKRNKKFIEEMRKEREEDDKK